MRVTAPSAKVATKVGPVLIGSPPSQRQRRTRAFVYTSGKSLLLPKPRDVTYRQCKSLRIFAEDTSDRFARGRPRPWSRPRFFRGVAATQTRRTCCAPHPRACPSPDPLEALGVLLPAPHIDVGVARDRLRGFFIEGAEHARRRSY